MLIQRNNVLLYKGVLKDVAEILFSDKVASGEEIEKFEKEFAEYIGISNAICAGSGRFALFLILKALGLKEKDEVIVPAFTFKAVPQSIINAGLKPVFIDVEEDSLSLNPHLIEKKITSRTKAIIATHIFGNPCELSRILPLAKKYNLYVIEDCAQACGTKYLGRKVGSFGDASFFSFSITKIPTTLWGGIIVTGNNSLAEKIRRILSRYNFPSPLSIQKEFIKSLFLSFLLDRKFYSFFFPFFYILEMTGFDPLKIYRRRKKEFTDVYTKFTNIQALIGRRQLEQLEKINNRRRENVKIFKKHLRKEIKCQKVLSEAEPVFVGIAIKGYSDILRKKLLSKGIEIDTGYVHNCAKLFGEVEMFPVTEKIINEWFSLNINWYHKEDVIIRVAEIINSLIH